MDRVLLLLPTPTYRTEAFIDAAQAFGGRGRDRFGQHRFELLGLGKDLSFERRAAVGHEHLRRRAARLEDAVPTRDPPGSSRVDR